MLCRGAAQGLGTMGGGGLGTEPSEDLLSEGWSQAFYRQKMQPQR